MHGKKLRAQQSKARAERLIHKEAGWDCKKRPRKHGNRMISLRRRAGLPT